MFSKLSGLPALYISSRILARFKAQGLLDGLPFSFLTQRAAKTAANLPETPEGRLAAALNEAGAPAQILASYLALYPDIIGRYKADLLRRSVAALADFPTRIDAVQKKQLDRLLKTFYILSNKNTPLREMAEHFEQLSDADMDFRLEAAAMERINDHFYEDDCLKVVLPDWIGTTKDVLSLEKKEHLRPIASSPNRERTAVCLIKTVVLSILRDGFVFIPSKAGCRVDDKGNLYIVQTQTTVLLSARQRFLVSSFLEALHSKNYRQAAKVLLTSGYLPDFFPAPELIRLIEETDKKAPPLLTAQKVDFFLKRFANNGIFMPHPLRFCAMALMETEGLCRGVLNVDGDIWENAIQEFDLFLPKGKEITDTDRTDDFKNAFSLPEHQAERLKVQQKKAAAFQEDLNKIPEIIRRQTIGAQFKPGKRNYWKLVLLIALFFAIATALYF